MARISLPINNDLFDENDLPQFFTIDGQNLILCQGDEHPLVSSPPEKLQVVVVKKAPRRRVKMTEEMGKLIETKLLKSGLNLLSADISRMIEQKDVSEITITFGNEWRLNYDNDDLRCYLINYFNFVPITIKELLLVEEYGENLNMHFHGLIRGLVKDLSKLKSLMMRRFGCKQEIAYIRKPELYCLYLMKEQTKQTKYIHIDFETLPSIL